MTSVDPFDLLLSEEVYAEGVVASDVASLCRRLSRTEQVAKVRQFLASDPDRIRELGAFADWLARQPHDSKFRHPNDIAICAVLVVLRSSPLSQVQNLFTRLSKESRPSLIWVRRMAEYCRELFVPSQFGGFAVPALLQATLVYLTDIVWSDPVGTGSIYEFDGDPTSESIHA